MSDPTAPPAIPAGWYPDPSGAQQQRWWDGIQWSQSTQPTPYSGITPYSAEGVNFSSNTGVNPNTRAVWAIALAPLLVIPELVILFAIGAMTPEALMDPAADMGAINSADLILRVVAYALVIVLAGADWRELSRRGVVRPFHWGYAFLGIVYMIGRTVVAKRRTGRGLAPLFVWIGSMVASWIIPVAVGVILVVVYSIPSY